jgi:hypothetical protein
LVSNAFLYKSGLLSKLSDNQRIVFNVARSGGMAVFTITQVKERLGCAYNTAASVLNGLVDLQVFRKEKVGSEWVYSMVEAKRVVQAWD